MFQTRLHLSNLAILNLAIAAAFSLPVPATAGISFNNGNFSLDSNGQTITTNGQPGYNNYLLDNWTTDGYNFLFLPSSTDTSGTTADSTGATGKDGNLKLWGPDDGSDNGLTVPPVPSGDTNILAADGAYEVGAIWQEVTGLVVGDTEAVTFYWAAAQQHGYNGTTYDMWTVSLGSQSFNTLNVTNPSNGFSGWFYETFYFTATAVSENLSFLATGLPDGVPPFSLLADVNMTQTTPEAATSILMLGGFGILAAARTLRARRRRKGK